MVVQIRGYHNLVTDFANLTSDFKNLLTNWYIAEDFKTSNEQDLDGNTDGLYYHN